MQGNTLTIFNHPPPPPPHNQFSFFNFGITDLNNHPHYQCFPLAQVKNDDKQS